MNLRFFSLSILLIFNQLYSLDWISEIRTGVFYPKSSEASRFYPDRDFKGEVGVNAVYLDNWIACENINYFRKKNLSIDFHDKTNFQITPSSSGLKSQLFLSDFLAPYLGLGLSYLFLNIKNSSYPIKEHMYRNNLGLIVKSGSYIAIRQNLLLDVFLDCYFQKINFQGSNTAQVSVFRVGGSLGYRF